MKVVLWPRPTNAVNKKESSSDSFLFAVVGDHLSRLAMKRTPCPQQDGSLRHGGRNGVLLQSFQVTWIARFGPLLSVALGSQIVQASILFSFGSRPPVRTRNDSSRSIFSCKVRNGPHDGYAHFWTAGIVGQPGPIGAAPHGFVSVQHLSGCWRYTRVGWRLHIDSRTSAEHHAAAPVPQTAPNGGNY